jgi:hypothetical protein
MQPDGHNSAPGGRTSRTRRIEDDLAKRNSIAGRITNAFGQPVEGLDVVLVLPRVDGEHALKRTTTDKDGRYQILLEALVGEGLRNARLRVGKAEQVLGSRPVQIGRNGNLVLPDRTPLFQRLKNGLAEPGAAAADAQNKELLAKLTGATVKQIARYSLAAKLSKDLSIPEQAAFALAANGRLQNSAAIFALAPDAVQRALDKSAAAREIESIPPDEAKKLIEGISRKAVEAMSKARIEARQLAMGDLLAMASAGQNHRAVPTMHMSTWPCCIRCPPALSVITACGTPCAPSS